MKSVQFSELQFAVEGRLISDPYFEFNPREGSSVSIVKILFKKKIKQSVYCYFVLNVILNHSISEQYWMADHTFLQHFFFFFWLS